MGRASGGLPVIDGPVVVRRWIVPVPALPRAADGLKLAHISDLHLYRWNRTIEHARTLLLSLEYDVLLVTGNLCDDPHRWADAAELCRRFFPHINPSGGTLAVLGHRDPPELADQSDLGLTFLRNRSAVCRVNGSHVVLAGVEQSAHARGDVSGALSGVQTGQGAILLAHYPSTIHQVPASHVSLTLAGHTLGGQLRLPLLGALRTGDRISRQMARGLHVVRGRALHISAGLGVPSRFPWRLRCPPEITILTLTVGNEAPTLKFTVPAAPRLRRRMVAAALAV
ncbi:MAG TPA: hypothetical protein VGM03_04825 [Phycisphaerae bacterium]